MLNLDMESITDKNRSRMMVISFMLNQPHKLQKLRGSKMEVLQVKFCTHRKLGLQGVVIWEKQ